jgi:hypothetical protein
MPVVGAYASAGSGLRLDGYIGSLCVSGGTVLEIRYSKLSLEYAFGDCANQDPFMSCLLIAVDNTYQMWFVCLSAALQVSGQAGLTAFEIFE